MERSPRAEEQRRGHPTPDLAESDVGPPSNFTHSNCSSVFSMDPLHFSPFTHPLPPPACLSCSSWQYMVTRRSLCAAATPCLERSPEHKAEVRVYLSYTSPSQASLLPALLIRLLYMFTNTTAERMIMSRAHVAAGPPRRINNIPSVYVTRRRLKTMRT